MKTRKLYRSFLAVITIALSPLPYAHANDTATIVADVNGQCLAVNADDSTSQKRIEQAACDGSATQAFSFVLLEGGEFQIVAKQLDQCLEAGGPGENAENILAVSACDGAPGQGFVLKPVPDFRYTLHVNNQDLCVTAGSDLKSSVTASACNGGDEQVFRIEATAE